MDCSSQAYLFDLSCGEVDCAYKNGQAMSCSSAQFLMIVYFCISCKGGGQLALIPLLIRSTRGNYVANLFDLNAGFINLHVFAPLPFFVRRKRTPQQICEFNDVDQPSTFVRRKMDLCVVFSRNHDLIMRHAK